MRITPVEHGLDLAQSDLVRSPGLHLSEIYNSLFEELEPTRYVKGSLPDRTRLGMGFILEGVLEAEFKRRIGSLVAEQISRPSEFVTKEGIAFSPDMLIQNGNLRLGESKLTWMSSKDVPREVSTTFAPRFSKWFVQMQGYCLGLETPYARLYACFINSNYKPPKPELLAWDITFTARELKDNWSMLMSHAKHKRLFR